MNVHLLAANVWLAVATNGAGGSPDGKDAADSPFSQIGFWIFMGVIFLFAVIKVFSEDRAEKKSKAKAALQAEIFSYAEAAKRVEAVADAKTKELGQEALAKVDEYINQLNDDALRMDRMLKINQNLIEDYQRQTRAQANWSFFAALLAMIAGLTFVFWGGSMLFRAGQWEQVVSGSAITVIGGGVSGYIAATFIHVYEKCLLQLNRYFRQPVIRGHAFLAVFFADSLNDDELRKQSYQKVIARLTGLMRDGEGNEKKNDDGDDGNGDDDEDADG